MGEGKQLRRSHAGALIGGVCAGIGRHTGIDPALVRLGWVIIALLGGAGLALYLAAWTIIPDEDGQHTIAPLLVFGLFLLLPLLGLLYLVPVSITRAP